MRYIGTFHWSMATDKATSKSYTTEQASREKLVNAAREAWTNRLIDLSRRNNLLFYKPLLSGTLEISVSETLKEFLASGEAIPLSDLLGEDQQKASHVRAIARKGLENLEEKGLSTLYLALERCVWTARDGGRDPVAPIVLVPIHLKLKGQDPSATEIQIAGQFEINPVLTYVFQKELNLGVNAEHILGLGSPRPDSSSEEDPNKFDLDAILFFLNSVGAKVPGFKAEPFAVIGNFSFQKLAMVKDLEARREELFANDVVAAIAGDSLARTTLARSQIETDPSGLDTIPPDAEYAVLDADSSQQCAIVGITAGQSAVVHGPPGTGKSQTITNLIATLAAGGKRVLFVAEKRAALEVVTARLKAVELDHLAIDLHGAEQTCKKVMEQVARALNMVREASEPFSDPLHERFADRRKKLNHHDARMHRVQAPTHKTVYEMQGALLRLSPEVHSPVRWREADLMRITPEAAARVLDLLREARGFESLFNRTDPSPWTGKTFQDGQTVQRAIDLSMRLAYELLPDLSALLDRLTASFQFRLPKSIQEIANLSNLLQEADKVLSLYEEEIFGDVAPLLNSISPGHAGGFRALWYRTFNSNYRAAYRRSIALRRNSKARARDLYKELLTAEQVQSSWCGWAGPEANPCTFPERQKFDATYRRTLENLTALDAICQTHFQTANLSDIAEKISALAVDSETPFRILQLCNIERELHSLGVQRLVDEIRTTCRPSAQWGALFRYVWLKSTLDMLAINDPGIRGFVGSTHTGYVDDFKRLDSERLELARKRVRRAHAERAVTAMNKFPEQTALIRGEAAKNRKHKPLRQVFLEAKDVLTSVCPCWMASPLSVSQLIAATGVFDFVIFDEASQVLPEDAIPAVLRAKHVVVAGDNKQLPPTTFFAAAEEEEDDSDEEATGYESLLDMMIPFVKGFHLNWHYRSRDEALIAFSNRHIYDDKLVTFPGPGGPPAVSHVYVEWAPNSDGQEESSGSEVTRVVEMVLHHAESTPDVTLGVITMGIKHANRIQALLDRELAGRPHLADFFDTESAERFFIKNLERVQGDERDVVILSVGYGKDRAGNLPLRFGPILSEGGRRRLNVAVTRARKEIIVVSSFMHSDINSARVRPQTGLEFLKNYLQYADSGGRLLSDAEMTNEPMNDFESDVFETLNALGIRVVPQVGCSKFRIDLGALHPSQPGRFVLAIECDGATYHSSYTARDRDRLRQQMLENLGWTFHRIWSTDWFMRKDEEVARLLKAFEKAVEAGERSKPASELGLPKPQSQSSDYNGGSPERIPRNPPVAGRRSIDDYTGQELLALLTWVKSDGKLRTNDELADEMFIALGFSRRGSKIEAAIQRTIGLDSGKRDSPLAKNFPEISM